MSRFIAAYNTNGLAHHRLSDAARLLAELDFGGIALTLDVNHLDPLAPDHAARRAEFAELLGELGLRVGIETGARFNLNYRRKHYPSLLSRERGRRIDFLRRCIETAHALSAPWVSFWAGHDFDGVGPGAGRDLLVDGISRILPEAEAAGVDLAFEPEPGMFVETLADYRALKAEFPTPRFGLALDVGHLVVTGEVAIPDAIRSHRSDLICVTVEDMRPGIHEHLPFGDGVIDFPPIFAALDDIGYRGFVSVELSRASPDGAREAERAARFLERFRR